jgi:hypothetical protein
VAPAGVLETARDENRFTGVLNPGFSFFQKPVQSPGRPGMSRQEDRIGKPELVHQAEGKIHAVEMVGLVADGRQALEFAKDRLQFRGTDLSSEEGVEGVVAVVCEFSRNRLVGKQGLFRVHAVKPNVADNGIQAVGFGELKESVAGKRVPGLLNEQGDGADRTRVRNLIKAGPKIRGLYRSRGRFGHLSEGSRKLGKAVQEGQQKQPCRENWSHTVFVLFNKYGATPSAHWDEKRNKKG